MSYGDSASELIKELSRAADSLPHYDDVTVREIIEGLINAGQERTTTVYC